MQICTAEQKQGDNTSSDENIVYVLQVSALLRQFSCPRRWGLDSLNRLTLEHAWTRIQTIEIEDINDTYEVCTVQLTFHLLPFFFYFFFFFFLFSTDSVNWHWF